jgi:hypothetical protein
MGFEDTPITFRVKEIWQPIKSSDRPIEKGINLRMDDGLNMPFSLAGYRLSIIKICSHTVFSFALLWWYVSAHHRIRDDGYGRVNTVAFAGAPV